MLHEHTITYALSDEQEAMLMALTARYNRVIGLSITPAGLLESLLTVGSALLIDERMLGLRAALDTAEDEREREG